MLASLGNVWMELSSTLRDFHNSNLAIVRPVVRQPKLVLPCQPEAHPVISKPIDRLHVHPLAVPDSKFHAHQGSTEEVRADAVRSAVVFAQEDGHFVRKNLKTKKGECNEAEEFTDKFCVQKMMHANKQARGQTNEAETRYFQRGVQLTETSWPVSRD